MYYVKDIQKSFDGNHVLKGVCLDIEANRTTVLVGPSGSGKTTLLRCINLLEMPDSGVVHLNGDEISSARTRRPNSLAARRGRCAGRRAWYFRISSCFPIRP